MDTFETEREGFSTLGKGPAKRWLRMLLAGLIIIIAILAFYSRELNTPSEPSPTGNLASIDGVIALQEETPSLQDDKPVLVPQPPEVDPTLIDSLLPRDSILAIDDPRFQKADEGSQSLAPDERVIGLVINGDARAYPIPVLSVHEIVNDTVGGEPVVVTWCPLCYTALVFSRRVDEAVEPLSFGVSGKLLYETLVMYDRQSESLWSQLYGTAIDGPMFGARLAFFPSVFTNWNAWQQQHPETLVLDKDATCAQFQCGTYSTNPRKSYSVDPYKSYYNRPGAGVVDYQIPRDVDQGFGTAKERVLGVRVAGISRAYPYDALRDNSLIHDEIDGIPILIWFDPESNTGMAFLRTAGDMVLSFVSDSVYPAILIDEESGSRWEATSGTALYGPLAGTQLPPVVATSAFAFGWYDYFPDSETYSAN